MAECKSCHQPILWALTEKGRNLPLDPTPSPHGNVRLDSGAGDTERPLAVVLSAAAIAELGETSLYVPHWATCPSAQQHRRRRGR